MIGGNLEQLCRVGQTMDLVEDDGSIAALLEKALGIVEHAARAGQFAVEVLDIGERLAQDALASSPDPHEPDDGAPRPRGPNALLPERAAYHAISMSYG